MTDDERIWWAVLCIADEDSERAGTSWLTSMTISAQYSANLEE